MVVCPLIYLRYPTTYFVGIFQGRSIFTSHPWRYSLGFRGVGVAQGLATKENGARRQVATPQIFSHVKNPYFGENDPFDELVFKWG